jgi:hypothetical protein
VKDKKKLHLKASTSCRRPNFGVGSGLKAMRLTNGKKCTEFSFHSTMSSEYRRVVSLNCRSSGVLPANELSSDHDVQPTLIDHNDPALKKHVRSRLLHYCEYQREILPALIYSKLNTSGDAGDSIGEDLTSVVEECLSNCLAEYQLSSEENDQIIARDESSAAGIGEASSSSQGAVNFEISNGILFQETDLSRIPRFAGDLGSFSEALSFGGSEPASNGDFGYGISSDDPLFLGLIPYPLGQTAEQDGQNTWLDDFGNDDARCDGDGAPDQAVDASKRSDGPG